MVTWTVTCALTCTLIGLNGPWSTRPFQNCTNVRHNGSGPIGTNQIVLPCSISPVGIITSTLFPKNKIVIVEGKSNKGSRNIFELNRGIHETCVVKPNMNEVFDCTIIPVSIIHINYNTWIIILQGKVQRSIHVRVKARKFQNR